MTGFGGLELTDKSSIFDAFVPRSPLAGAARWEPPKANARRRALFDLAPATHCSILGTCLALGELRKAVVKIAGENARDLSHHEMHTLGVRYAATPGAPSKLLNKMLDEKHAASIKRLQKATCEEDLRNAWSQALKDGAIEGTYWAISTHPLAGEDFFAGIFGDVHMLSHLVGSANRADVRRLAQLDAERDALLAEIGKLRRQIAEGWSRRDRELQDLRDALSHNLARAPDASGAGDDTRVGTLERLTADLRNRLDHEVKRTQKLEEDLLAARQETAEVRTQLSRATNEVAALSQEVDELERRLGDEEAALTHLADRTILYVGGLGKGVRFIRAAVENLGAHFLHHDGGMEQANILLRGLVGRADAVLVPLDYVSHDAAVQCKKFATQAGKPFVPLPHAGVGSVLRALRELEM